MSADRGDIAAPDPARSSTPRPARARSPRAASGSSASKATPPASASSRSATSKSSAEESAAAKQPAPKTSASKTGASKTGASKTSTSKTSAAKTSAAKTSAAKAPRTTRSTAKPATDANPAESASDAVEARPASKRSAASRAASSSAAAARGEAAKAARTPSASAAKARARANDARQKAAPTRQRVAAALTTDTTAAERSPRKSDVTESSTGTAGASTVQPIVAPAPPADTLPETTADAAAEPEVVIPAPIPDGETAPAVTEPAAEEPAPAPEPERAPAAVEPEATVAEETPVPVAGAVAAASVAAAAAVVAEPAVPSEPAPVGDAPTAAADAPAVDDTPVAPDARTVGAERGIAVIPVVTQKPAPRKKRTLRVARGAPPADAPRVLTVESLVKRYGDTTAVDAISLEVRAGSFYGIVGPNGAGKTTTLSMITGLLRPDAGSVHVNGIDVWKQPRAAKRITGVLPDRLRLFDRLTGAELLYYSGSLRGLDHRTVLERSADLAAAFGLEDALDRLVADYSAGMTKKVALACAMIHSPRVLVLDEPFESVDPVSAANLTDILERYVAGGGTVLLSSHGMDLIERVCDSAAIIVGGRVLASGTLDEVRGGRTLEDRFVELAGGRKAAEGMEWLHSFSD